MGKSFQNGKQIDSDISSSPYAGSDDCISNKSKETITYHRVKAD